MHSRFIITVVVVVCILVPTLDSMSLRVSGCQGVQSGSEHSSGCGVWLLQWGYTCPRCTARPANFSGTLLSDGISLRCVSRFKVLNKNLLLTCAQIQSLPSLFLPAKFGFTSEPILADEIWAPLFLQGIPLPQVHRCRFSYFCCLPSFSNYPLKR